MPKKVPSTPLEIGTQLIVWDSFRRKSEVIAIQEIMDSKHGKNGKLAAPYDERMGVFSLDTLIKEGRVSSRGINAYLRELWKQDEVDAFEKSKLTLSSHFDPKVDQAKKLIGLPSDDPLTPQTANTAYKSKAKANHPDAGGTTAAMQDLNEARDVLKEKIRGQKRKSEIWGKDE
jgi:hypothetical protein